MKKLLIFTLYTKNGASSNFRILMYMNELSKKYNVKYFPFWDDKYVKKYMNNKKKYFFFIVIQYVFNLFKRIFQIVFIAPKFDYVFYQKSVIPAFPINFINYLHKKRCKVLFDVDDAVYLSKKDFSNIIASKVDCVLVGNNNLFEHYKAYNKNIILLPTVEYTPMYLPFIKDTFKKKIIGWIGSNSTQNNLNIIVKPLNKIIQNHPEVEFWFISSDDNSFTSKIRNSKFIKWNYESYMELMSNFTIGIMPLYDNLMNQNKCGFKLIQYMNLVKPVIASDVGINRDVVGNCGIIADTQDEWFNAFEKLLFDENVYKKFQNNIKKDFFDKYSFDNNLRIIENTIDKVGDYSEKR